MKNIFFLFFALALFLVDCNRQHYQTSVYEAYANEHQSIAVLPSQTITTGRIPEDWTEEMIKTIEENESFAFQTAVFDEVALRSGSNQNDISIDIQHYSETNAKLKKANIGFRESWEMSPTELAEILEVDAVVRSTVKKDMYLTDLESFSASVAHSALALITNHYSWFLPNKTSEVFLSSSIIDGQTSSPIWTMRKNVQTDWNCSHDESVRKLARIMARNFPYRD